MATPSQKPHPASTLLARAHSPEIAADIYRDKIQKRPLLLRPSSPDPDTNAREQRRRARVQKSLTARRSKKPKPLSAKQKRALGIYDIPPEQQSYAVLEPLKKMWVDYIRQVLGLVQTGDEKTQRPVFLSPASAGPMLVSADYHGAEVEIVRSKCVSRVGIKGIVVKDLKFSFEVVGRKGGVKRIPKEGTVFRIVVPVEDEESGASEELDKSGEAGEEGPQHEKTKMKPLVFELHGNQLENRAPDRANRKFKMHIDPDL